MDTPYQWTKQVASHWGGTRNGAIVRWPNGIKAKGEIRNQFHHVIDVAPTILEATGVPAPTFVNGAQQAPLEGVSMAYSFDDATAADRHTTQYFEMFVNRGLPPPGLHPGHAALDAVDHGRPASAVRRGCLGADGPRPYGLSPTMWRQNSPIESGPSPAAVPDRGGQCPSCPWTTVASSGSNPDVAGRPGSSLTATARSCSARRPGLTENSVIVTKNKSYAVTANN